MHTWLKTRNMSSRNWINLCNNSSLWIQLSTITIVTIRKLFIHSRMHFRQLLQPIDTMKQNTMLRSISKHFPQVADQNQLLRNTNKLEIQWHLLYRSKVLITEIHFSLRSESPPIFIQSIISRLHQWVVLLLSLSIISRIINRTVSRLTKLIFII